MVRGQYMECEDLYSSGGIAQVLREMRTYRLQILGISEIRWTGIGRLELEGTRIFYSEGQRHERGVVILLHKEESVLLGTDNNNNEGNNGKATIRIL